MKFMFWYGYVSGYAKFLPDEDPHKKTLLELATELLEYGKTLEKADEEKRN